MDEKLTLVMRVDQLTRQIKQLRDENKRLDRKNRQLSSLIEINKKKVAILEELEKKITMYEIKLVEKDQIIEEMLEQSKQEVETTNTDVPEEKEKEIDDIFDEEVLIVDIHYPNKTDKGKKELSNTLRKQQIRDKMEELASKQLIEELIQQETNPPEIPLNAEATKFECNICASETNLEDVCWLEHCDHKFCNECMIGYIRFGITSGKLDFDCPVTTCKLPIDFTQVKSILSFDSSGYELIKKYDKFLLDRALQQMDDIAYCPNNKCSLPCPRNGTEDMVKCEGCSMKFCFKCLQQWHTGFTCDSYQKWKEQFKDYDGSFLDWISESSAKQCPKCKYWVHKVEGCSHIACRCGEDFCYDCGGSYRREHDGVSKCTCNNGDYDGYSDEDDDYDSEGYQ